MLSSLKKDGKNTGMNTFLSHTKRWIPKGTEEDLEQDIVGRADLSLLKDAIKAPLSKLRKLANIR